MTLPRRLAAVRATFIFNPAGTASPDSDGGRKGGAGGRGGREEEIRGRGNDGRTFAAVGGGVQVGGGGKENPIELLNALQKRH